MVYPDEKCRRCLLRESGSEDIFAEVKRCVERIKPEEKAEDTLYSDRLKKCSECEFLISGTCLKCGCYVELRAAYKNNCCPLPKSRKLW